ncbi:MAG: hypothetical protein KDB26_01495 [Microthrixaceae bacterium]|nr:hypothetical protein [Microthrixaceae bacterium]
MTDDDAFEERLRESFRDLGEKNSPEIGDPSSIADGILSRPVAAGGSAAYAAPGRVAPWKMLGVLAVVGAAGIGTGIWAGSSGGDKSAPTDSAGVVELASADMWRCPDNGVVGRLTSGDRVLLTGRTEDGSWAQLRSPGNPSSNVWITKEAIDPDGGFDDLPVVECDDPDANPRLHSIAPLTDSESVPESTTTTLVPEDTIPGSDSTTTSTEPSPTTTIKGGGSTTTTTPSSTTTRPTTTTTTPDRTGPSITSVSASPNRIWTLEMPGVPCPPDKSARTVMISAAVSDPGGVSSVRFEWSVAGQSGTVTMTKSGNTWTGTTKPFPANTLPNSGPNMNQTVTVTVRAVDTAGNSSTSATSFQLRSSGECFG